ncbi:MAG: CDP-alcohol phosphatidyltransferase family protein [Thermoanaerobaculia bacterium]
MRGERLRGPWTIPNLITLLRLAVLPVFLYAIATVHPVVALSLFVVAGISDGLDGYLARALNMKSALGAVLDPIADKLLMMSSYVMLSIPSYPARVHIPLGVTLLVLSRDILMLLVALLVILTTGIKDFPATFVGKTNTVVEILAVLAVLCADVWKLPGPFVWVPFGAVGASTVVSGIHYAVLVSHRVAEKERG